jgi:GxxExxY protein
MRINDLTAKIIQAAIRVHSNLGPGLLESAYKFCLIKELQKLGLRTASELPLPLVYEGEKLEAGYRIDLMVESIVIVEIKAVPALAPIHEAQLLTYLRLSGRYVGLLINFNVVRLKDGIRRFVFGKPPNDSVALCAPSVPSVVKATRAQATECSVPAMVKAPGEK